jgi:phosphatidate phosphatase LPIN
MLRLHVKEATHSHDIVVPNRAQVEKINQVLRQSDYQEVNVIEFSDGEHTCEGYMYCYNYYDKLVISDIDGTITKSDLMGHIATHLDKDYTHIGTPNLFSKIQGNGYKFIYLSARPVTMAKVTRQYISKIKHDGHIMPVGPVITSPNKAMDSFIREVVIKEPHILKISILSTIGNLFHDNPYVAGFGNRETDAVAYSKVGIAPDHVFIIDKKSIISVDGVITYKNYLDMMHDVDNLFPDIRMVKI